MVIRLISGVVEGRDCGDELEEYDPEAINVARGSEVEGGAVCGVHVAGGSLHLGDDMRRVAHGPHLHEPEVRNLGLEPLVDQDVARLDIPVDYARADFLMQISKPCNVQTVLCISFLQQLCK